MTLNKTDLVINYYDGQNQTRSSNLSEEGYTECLEPCTFTWACWLFSLKARRIETPRIERLESALLMDMLVCFC